MTEDYEPGVDLYFQLSNQIDLYRRTFHEYWQEAITATIDNPNATTDEMLFATHLSVVLPGIGTIAKAVLSGHLSDEAKSLAMGLAGVLTPGENVGGSRLQLIPGNPVVLEALNIELADAWLSHYRRFEVSEAAQDKLAYATMIMSVIDGHLSRIAAGYYSRVVRLWLFGFKEEAVALARSTLESALEEAVPENALESVKTRKDGKDSEGYPAYTLANRTWGAVRLGRLSPEAGGHASAIAKAANKILHSLPQLNMAPEHYVLRLGGILGQLFPYEGAEPGLQL